MEFDYPTGNRFVTACHNVCDSRIYMVKAIMDSNFEVTYATFVPNIRIAAQLIEFLHNCDARGDSFEELEAAADDYAEWLIADWRDLRFGLVGLLSFVLRRLRRLFGAN